MGKEGLAIKRPYILVIMIAWACLSAHTSNLYPKSDGSIQDAMYCTHTLDMIAVYMLLVGNSSKRSELEFLNNLWGLGTE